ncbi:excalibur calcium-binding domain-containing protein [Desulfotalea psychrophila]|uniref:Hypothetical cold-shock protein n=1 Tax=Desulfotalea psychrophila (strain LSv54 / DSM 12343) TaxID=177439 RepID=Q6ARQ9_DESPS|nr:excalibur calcium-binding domain-containing protein [Desulfotalea psychrophila]CAG34966.1 hypothetical cold-shock protein [Desulfotalea psychrophila LSv54]
MATVRLQGKIEKWVGERGFGFIKSEKSAKSIFVHISAFDRAISRAPRVGDTISYCLRTDHNGKTKAVDAIIKGLPLRKRRERSQPTGQRPYKKQETKNSWRIFVICLALLIGFASLFYNRLQASADQTVTGIPLGGIDETFVQREQLSLNYSCAGKIHCPEMTSCQEAQFYLSNCPDVKLDGDGDGIPCEEQFCN